MEYLFIVVFAVFVQIDRIQNVMDRIGDKFAYPAFLFSQLHNVTFIVLLEFEVHSHQNSDGGVVVFEFLVEVDQL